jgi:hypothetical protein
MVSKPKNNVGYLLLVSTMNDDSRLVLVWQQKGICLQIDPCSALM